MKLRPALLAVLVLLSSQIYAADKPADKEQLRTIKARAGKAKVEVTLDGIFEPRKAHELMLTTKQVGQARVLSLVEPGIAVKKGDVLVKLDTENLDEQIAELEASEKLAEHYLVMAQTDLKLSEVATEQQIADTKRNYEMAKENFDNWMKTDWAFRDRYHQLDIEDNEMSKEINEIELAELKRMYRNDDLVEATEAIVLKRQEQRMRQALLAWERYQLTEPWLREVVRKREMENQQKALRDAERNWNAVQKSFPLAIEKKRLEVAKAERDRERAKKNLAELKEDRAQLNIVAPADGVVYYGQCIRGNWNADQFANRLRVGGVIQSHEVFMTVVDPSSLDILVNVAEKDISDISNKDNKISVEPIAFPDEKIDGKLESVTVIPAGPGRFSATCSAKVGKQIVPGMTCKVTFTHAGKEIILVPATSVAVDEGGAFVYVPSKDKAGEPVRKDVKVARQTGADLEITEGIVAGEEILQRNPDKK